MKNTNKGSPSAPMLCGRSGSRKPLYVSALGSGRAHTVFVGSPEGKSLPSLTVSLLFEILSSEEKRRIFFPRLDFSFIFERNRFFFIPCPDGYVESFSEAGSERRFERDFENRFESRFEAGSGNGSENRALLSFLRRTKPKYLVCFEIGEEFLYPYESEAFAALCQKTVANKASGARMTASLEGWFSKETGGASLRAAIGKSDTPEKYCARLSPFISALLTS